MTRATLIDFDELLQGPPGTITHLVAILQKWSCWDGVHPDAAGYAAARSRGTKSPTPG